MATGWRTASVCEPASGETECGDRVILRRSGEALLAVVVDALGHGQKAAVVATLAERYVESLPWPSDMTSEAIITGIGEQLRLSRGAAAMVCLLRGDQLDGCGVGNVELRSVGSAVPVMLTPGVLGSARPSRLRSFSARLLAPTSLFLFSDGISSRAPFSDLARLPAAEACQALLRDHRKPHDDASALVAKLESVPHVAGN